ncbi:MAG: sensor domain-containing diguanylate cyclase [Azonexaceae bacterium]|nr:sensor domain-containing diguanylate cyclase [Azonexaceae bacterium]
MPSQKQLLDVISIQTDIVKLGLDLGEVMSQVVERTLALIGADGVAIELAEGDDMVYRAVSGIANPHLGLRLKRASSLSGRCVAVGESIRCDDAEEDARVDRNACRQVGLRSMIVIPLRYRDHTVGVLKAMSAEPAKFGQGDERLLGLLSELIGAAMHFATRLGRDDLFHRATHDALTGLANRSLFIDRLRNIMARLTREQARAGVLMIDMDGLKQINDGLGHRTGDAVLCEFARRLARSARGTDTVARFGGDEFAILLNPIDALPHSLEAAVHRLHSEISLPFVFEGQSLPLRASIGSACFPEESDDVDALLELADQRMYAMKSTRHRERAAS